MAGPGKLPAKPKPDPAAKDRQALDALLTDALLDGPEPPIQELIERNGPTPYNLRGYHGHG
jgi:hypothetical protein